jgi:trans-aconitate methyltransferase
MEKILRAEDVKPNFEALKTRWDELLQKYFTRDGILDPNCSVDIPCPHCGTKTSTNEFVLNGFHHKTCSNCKTIYVSPRLNDQCTEELYSDEYYSEMYAKSMIPAFEKRKEMIGRRKFGQTVSQWGKPGVGRVLNIGAGIGEVTDVFKDEGWETHATEMNKTAIQWLNSRGHKNVFHGALDAYQAKEKFDIVMAWGVVEHVLDPNWFLHRVHQLLLSGGIFVSEVPHGQSLLIDFSRRSGLDPKRILMGEQHIVLYSTKAYVDLHSRNGFELIHLQTNGLDVSTICREGGIKMPNSILDAMQESIDEKGYGDLLRGFWRKLEV